MQVLDVPLAFTCIILQPYKGEWSKFVRTIQNSTKVANCEVDNLILSVASNLKRKPSENIWTTFIGVEINEPLLRTSRVDEIAKWKVVYSMLDVSEWTGYMCCMYVLLK